MDTQLACDRATDITTVIFEYMKLLEQASPLKANGFVMGRKNWLFANTPADTQSSAVIYSLIETAQENKLDPYRYLLWVLQRAPVLS